MGFAGRYQEASFRGILFRVKNNTRSSGLLVDEHVYPGKQAPANVYPEILGQGVRSFSITGYITGKDHDRQRNQLERALDEPSVGQLVLPLRPKMNVVCRSSSSSEDESQLGTTIFQMTFTVAGEKPSPVASPNTGRALASASGELRNAAASDFAAAWNPKGPRWVYDSAADSCQSITADYLGRACTAAGVPDVTDEALSLFGQNFESGPDLAQAFLSITTKVGEGANTSGNVMNLLHLGAPMVQVANPFFTSTSSQIAANSGAVSNLLDRAFVAEAAARVVRVPLDSDVEASSLLSSMRPAIDRVANGASSPVFRAAKGLSVAVGNDLSCRGREAGKLISIPIKRTDSFENISHKLYDSGQDAAALIRRNRAQVPHPGFIPPGVSLEAVLKPDFMETV